MPTVTVADKVNLVDVTTGATSGAVIIPITQTIIAVEQSSPTNITIDVAQRDINVGETNPDVIVNSAHPNVTVEGVFGSAGPEGPAGVGVPVGGTTNQVLTKQSTANYDTYWTNQTGGGASDVFDVRTYGAVGNDSTNDTTAIQTALTAGAGKTVLFPAGTYKITTALNVSANTTITGTGTIHQTGTGVNGLNLNGSGITIENITLKGRHTTNVFAGGEYAISAVGTAGSHRTDIRVHNVKMSYWGIYGIYLFYATRFNITDCYIHDIGYTGIGVLSGFDGVIDGCRIDNIAPGTDDNVYGIALTMQSGAYPRSERITVSNCIVSRVLWEAVDTHGGNDLTFTGNVLFDNYDNFALVGGPDSVPPTNITITGNTIFNTSTGAAPGKNAGIRCWGVNITSAPATGIVITGNNFNNLVNGISLYTTKGTVVSGNNFKDINGTGIEFNQNTHNVLVTGNTFIDMWHNVYNSSAMEITGYGQVSGYVADNILLRGIKTGTYVNDFGIRAVGTPTGVSLVLGQNEFTAAGAAAVYAEDMTMFKTGGWNGTDPVGIPTGVTARAALMTLGLGNTLIADAIDPGEAVAYTTIHHGNGAPAASLGEIGNFYLDEANDVLYGPKIAVGTYNLLTANQASIETNLAGMDFGDCTITRSTAQAAHGSASVLATQTGTAGNYSVYAQLNAAALTALNAANEGDVWTMYGSVRAGAASSTGARVWLVSNLGNFNDDPDSAITTTGFTDILTKFTVPAGTFTNAYVTGLTFDSSNTGSAYWDKFGLWAGTNTNWVLPGLTDPWPIALKSPPSGGTTGQVLKKLSNTDYDWGWVT